MGNRSAAFAAICLMFLSQRVAAVEAFGTTATCGEWIERTDNNTRVKRLQIESWIDGYLSGLAVGNNKEFWNRRTGRIDDKSVYLWIDNYCRANPLKNVVNAADSLFKEHTSK